LESATSRVSFRSGKDRLAIHDAGDADETCQVILHAALHVLGPCRLFRPCRYRSDRRAQRRGGVSKPRSKAWRGQAVHALGVRRTVRAAVSASQDGATRPRQPYL